MRRRAEAAGRRGWALAIAAALLDTLAFVSFNLGVSSAYTTIVTALASLFSAVTVVLACGCFCASGWRWRSGPAWRLFAGSSAGKPVAATCDLGFEGATIMSDIKNAVERQFNPVTANYATSAVHRRPRPRGHAGAAARLGNDACSTPARARATPRGLCRAGRQVVAVD